MDSRDYSPRFSGFCKDLDMRHRTATYDCGKTFYPVRVRLNVSRRRAGISKEGMARLLGFHRTTILRYETGAIRTIDNDTVTRWAEICQVKPAWILDGGCSGDQTLDFRATKEGCRTMGYPLPINYRERE